MPTDYGAAHEEYLRRLSLAVIDVDNAIKALSENRLPAVQRTAKELRGFDAAVDGQTTSADLDALEIHLANAARELRAARQITGKITTDAQAVLEGNS